MNDQSFFSFECARCGRLISSHKETGNCWGKDCGVAYEIRGWGKEAPVIVDKEPKQPEAA